MPREYALRTRRLGSCAAVHASLRSATSHIQNHTLAFKLLSNSYRRHSGTSRISSLGHLQHLQGVQVSRTSNNKQRCAPPAAC